MWLYWLLQDCDYSRCYTHSYSVFRRAIHFLYLNIPFSHNAWGRTVCSKRYSVVHVLILFFFLLCFWSFQCAHAVVVVFVQSSTWGGILSSMSQCLLGVTVKVKTLLPQRRTRELFMKLPMCTFSQRKRDITMRHSQKDAKKKWWSRFVVFLIGVVWSRTSFYAPLLICVCPSN